jgi:pyruvate carboxylase
LLKHPTFLSNEYTTTFIDHDAEELFDFRPRRDRATRILRYIADITVNGHPETEGRPDAARRHRRPSPAKAVTSGLEHRASASFWMSKARKP